MTRLIIILFAISFVVFSCYGPIGNAQVIHIEAPPIDGLKTEHWPIEPVTGSISDVHRELARYPDLIKIFDQVFRAGVAPNLLTRAAVKIHRPHATIENAQVWSSTSIRNDFDCSVKCIVLQLTATVKIYQEEQSVIDFVLDNYADITAKRLCVKQYLGDPNGACDTEEVLRPYKPDYSSNSYHPFMNNWIDFVNGYAFSWEIIKVNSDNNSRLQHALILSNRPEPSSCNDYLLAGYYKYIAACGIFEHYSRSGYEYISYCMKQRLPGLTTDPKFCIPLFRRGDADWQIANIAGVIIEPGTGGGDSATCSFESKLSELELASQITSAFEPVSGQNLRVAKQSNGDFLFAGRFLNLDVSKVNRPRPWAFVEMGMRLSSHGGRSYSLAVNVNYTVSAQRMIARNDGHEVNEQEENRISHYLTVLLEKAVASNGRPAQLGCDEGFGALP